MRKEIKLVLTIVVGVLLGAMLGLLTNYFSFWLSAGIGGAAGVGTVLMGGSKKDSNS